jgi:hypothetical protein
MGLFFHAHRFDPGHLISSRILRKCMTALTVAQWEASRSHPDDLAYFGLCEETPRESGEAELDRFSLTPSEGESSWGLDESWLSLL